jgi:3-oxoadipate enol-lactonase
MPCLLRPWGHMNYRDSGVHGGMTILFANSLGTDLRMWEGVTTALPSLRCISFDKRGHGLSATPAQPWTVEDLAQDVIALMDHLGVGRAIVAGCSVGGLIAQAVAVAHPDRVSGLILSNTAAKIGTAEMWATRIAALRAGGIAAISGAILERWFAPDFLHSPDSLPWQTMLLRCDLDGYIGTCEALAKADLRAHMPTLRVPTLALAGSEDQATPLALVAETAALIPGARLETLFGSGHIPAIDAPQKTADLIQSFAKDLPT